MCHRISNFASGLALLVAGWTFLAPAHGQAATSFPAGFRRLQLLGGSDTLVSMPFCRPPAACGLVAAITDNVVTVTSKPAWTPNQFVCAAGVQTNTYFMVIASGALEGAGAPISANGVDSLTLQLAGGSLAGLQVGDRVMVVPYWTLGSIFPGGAGVHASASPYVRKTEVFIPNLTGSGVNLSASKTYYFYAGHWRLFGQSGVKDDDPLSSSAYFVVRHNLGTSTTLTIRGAVVTSKWAVSLRASPLQKEDNFVALPRPGALSLNESGLISSGAFAPSPSRFSRTDELFTFDNTQKGINKSASATYFYSNGKWQKYPDTTDVGALPIFTPGTGVIIRKAPTAGGLVWMNSPNY